MFEPEPKIFAACPVILAKSHMTEAIGSLFGGELIGKITALIKQGLADAPAILAALQAAGVTLPPLVLVLINALLEIEKA
jgi:hypothetical protein